MDRLAISLRRSARNQNKTPEPGSADQPITIQDSPESESKPTPAGSSTVENSSSESQFSITILPPKLPSSLPGLTKEGRKLLHYKQSRLQSPTSQVHQLHEFCDPNSEVYPALRNAVDATLVFAQEEAGTAVCISQEGLLLTCSHCVAETAEDLDLDKIWWLLFASGCIVQAKTIKWDPRRDLALLHIIAAQLAPTTSHFDRTVSSLPQPRRSTPILFPSLSLSPKTPSSLRAPLLCVGHPGSEDLEVGRPGVATGYDVLHISEGRFRGYAKGQDVHDNSEIGALKHDCWTYWGHSGAPLIEVKSGDLVGLHSSWDDQTAMRRGVGWEAIRAFLDEYEGQSVS